MYIPVIAGIPLHFWMGVLTFLLIIFQIISARHMFGIPFEWHRRNGYVVLFAALLHGMMVFSIYFLRVPIR